MTTVGDILGHRTFGRTAELERLDRVLEPDAKPITFVWGLPGIGKSTLLQAWLRQLEGRDLRVTVVDARDVDPTPEGFQVAVGSKAEPGVVVIDHFEAFRLVEAWLRAVWLPRLDARSRVVVASSAPPSNVWLGGGWDALVDVFELGPVDREAARAFGANDGVFERVGGHPLALRLAARVGAERLDDLDAGSSTVLLAELSRRFLDCLDDESDRSLLESVSVVRRVTVPVLRALVGRTDVTAELESLERMPFVAARSDGLRVHGVVRAAVAENLKALEPSRHRSLRREAFDALQAELSSVPRTALWRCTADLLYLLDTAAVRQAFFPEGIDGTYVGRPRDPAALRAIVERHAPAKDRDALMQWFDLAPDNVHVIHDGDDYDRAFYLAISGRGIPTALLDADPVLRAWARDARSRPGGLAAALFVRVMLDRDTGEGMGPGQAAAWLDVKRYYMQLRPTLRNVYAGIFDERGLQVMQRLGFVPWAGPSLESLTDITTAVLDMGPGSVEGWLSRNLEAELGESTSRFLDEDARQICLPTGRVDLTQLECALLACLLQARGKVVSRDELLAKVWGYAPGASTSNVVQAVVRTLRKKLGTYAANLETVRGAGYKYTA